jgi:tetratricopeptide (TPR) repeat protein
VLAGAAAAAVVIGTVALALTRGAEQPCRGAARNLIGVWDDARRAAVRAGLLATGASYAGDTADRVVAQLDRYSLQWVAAHESACRAARVHREQSETVLDERMSCLSVALTELDTLAEQLVHADNDVAQRAVSAAALLSPLQDCADVGALMIMAPLAYDAEVRLEYAQVAADIARAEALGAVGRYAEAIKVAEAAIPRARAIGARNLLAEALMRTGVGYLEVGDMHRAEDLLLKAALEANATTDDDLAVISWFELVRAARDLGHYTQAID